MVNLTDPGFRSATNQPPASSSEAPPYSEVERDDRLDGGEDLRQQSSFVHEKTSDSFAYTAQYDYDSKVKPGFPQADYADQSSIYKGEPGHKQAVSEDFAHATPSHFEDSPETPLVRDRAQQKQYQDLEYADPDVPQKPEKGLAKIFASAHYPLAQRIEDKKRGIGRQRIPFVAYTLTVIMVVVFIYELVLNARQQGSPISTKPVFNPMLGPSSSALINLGARYPPCMKLVTQIPPSTPMACMNSTTNPTTDICPVSELCGFGGINVEHPNQWFRFVTAIFLHAGIIHILLNMLAQIVLSAQIEREMGSGGFFVTYFAAGIFGNVLGGNFSLVGIPSVGASGAIFGTVAVTWVDLIAHWKYQYRPKRKLLFMTIELMIGIAIGYIPYVDNFAHIGGFVMGLFTGIVFYPIISESKRHKTVAWVFKLAAIPAAVILFVLLVKNFYTSDPYAACSGCRYLSCIPSAANNRCQGTGLITQ